MMNLPLEIIQIVFLKLCSTKTIFPLRDDPRLLVTHVCFQWRAIALRMPDLWANLRIPIDFPPPYDHIRAWIIRSAPSLLSVGSYGPIHYDTSAADVFGLIIPTLQRCASLKLCMDEPTIGRLLTLPPGSMHMLRNISIRATPTQYAWTTHAIIPCATAFQQCPQLRQVMFAFMGQILDPTIFELPWHQLTHLGMHGCLLHEYEMLNVLRQCTALQECSISTFPAREIDTQRIAALSLSPIVLPSLHILRLELGDPRGQSVHFVHALRLPRLRNLRLAVASWLPRMQLPLLRPLLSETVRDLDLSRWSTTDLSAVLALVPNIEMLKLNENDVELLRALGSGTIVPRLVSLRLGAVGPGDLFEMLETRMAAALADSGVTGFTNVSAVGSDAGGIDTTRLAALRAAGIQIVFRNQ